MKRLRMPFQILILCKTNVERDGFGIVRSFFSRLEMLRNNGGDDGNVCRIKPWSFAQHGLLGRFGNGDEVIDAAQRPMDPNFAGQIPLETSVVVQKADVMDGKDKLGSITPSPFWPGECRKMDVPGDVEDVGAELPSFEDDSEAVEQALTVTTHFNTFWNISAFPYFGKLGE